MDGKKNSPPFLAPKHKRFIVDFFGFFAEFFQTEPSFSLKRPFFTAKTIIKSLLILFLFL